MDKPEFSIAHKGETKDSPLIIDVRNYNEYIDGHVAGSINIPPEKFLQNNLPAELANIDKNREIILYCKTGSRSNVVKYILNDRGFTNVINGINQGRVEKMIQENK